MKDNRNTLENKNKILIRKYINQECSPAELEEIKALMLLPDAQQLFDEVLAEGWSGPEAATDVDQPHLNEKLSLFYQKLEAEAESTLAQETSTGHKLLRLSRKKYWSYAAIWSILVLSIGTYSLLKYRKAPAPEQLAFQEIVNPLGQRSRIVLPDSSEVFLGAGSKLRFPKKFVARSREISLEGEAFFQVTKDQHKPFIIHTGTVQTKVLGTSFRIEAFKGKPLVVAVATGKVSVDDYAGNIRKSLAILIPGQKVSYVATRAITGLVDVAELEGWKDARLAFHQQSMQAITNVLERWYNVKFSYENQKKAKEEISIVLQANVPLNKIMKVLSATGHFRYDIKSNHVTIH